MRLFVSFEGVEGSGKSTQVEMLHDFLVDMRISVVKTREPGGTAVGDRLRPVLLEPSNLPFSALAELFLYMAARAQLVKEVIGPSLENGTVVVSDRYMDSTVAYQGYGRGVNIELIDHLNRTVTNGCVPNLTILLDIDPELGLSRISTKPLRMIGRGKDRLEGESLEFHRRVRQGYCALAQHFPDRFFVVDARQKKEMIHKLVVQELMRRYKGLLPHTGLPKRANLPQRGA